MEKKTARVRVRIWCGVFLCLGMAAGAWPQKWARLGPEGGLVMSLGVSAGGDVYLGTTDGHVFVRESGARRWELRGRVGSRTDAVVTRLLGDPGERRRVFAAVWYQEPGAGGGVFESEDSGRTWKLAGLQGEAVRALEMAPSQPEILVAGTRSGVFRSKDGGTTWERISPAGDEELRNVDSIAVKPGDTDVIYAGTYHLPWKTVDGGKNWKSVAAGLIDDSDIMSLRVDKANPERVYLSACSGIYRSEDGGEDWTKLQGIPYAARRTQAIVQDGKSPKTWYAATAEGLWLTRDAGESWRRTTPADWVVNSVVVLPDAGSGKESVLVGTEAQGVLESTTEGESFAGVNEGYSHLVVKQLVGDSSEPRRLLLLLERGAQELLESRDGGRTWAAIALDAFDGQKKMKLKGEAVEEIYGSPRGWVARLQSGELWFWRERGRSWMQWKLRAAMELGARKTGASASNSHRTMTPLKLASNHLAFSGEDLFAATRQGMMRCDGGGICEPLKAFGRGEEWGPIWVSPDGKFMDVVSDRRVGISEDSGRSAIWRDLPVDGKETRWVEGSSRPGTPDIFLGTARGLYESTGAENRWQLRKEGLPAGQVEQWLQKEGLTVATLREGGMYISFDQRANWVRVDRDMERGRFAGVQEVEPGVLIVGSRSEGVLRLDFESKP